MTRFVLARPRNPNNIGATARAMANFGLKELFLVEPHAEAWEESRAAVGGEAVLKGARATTMAEALRGADLVLGTGDGRRALRRPLVDLPALSGYLAERLPAGGTLAVLFGSEKTGLSNAELSHCAAVVRIPTRAGCPSMNLGQAAAVIAYELARVPGAAATRAPRAAAADAGQREDLIAWAVRAMEKASHMKADSPARKAERLRLWLNRAPLDRRDAGFLRAYFKRAAARP
jgi:tRNA/rRNA methyltransferase